MEVEFEYMCFLPESLSLLSLPASRDADLLVDLLFLLTQKMKPLWQFYNNDSKFWKMQM